MKFFMLTVCLFGTVFAKSPSTEWKPLPVDDPTVIKLANQAVAHINEKWEKLFYNKLIEIKEAKSVADDGITYMLKMIIRLTYCPKSKPYHDDCEIRQASSAQICTVEGHKPSGSEEIKISNLSCDTIPLPPS
uniref:Cystatin domain-containing protein n=2 Tax=Tetranychus urticae TaxID=32264 RepID=T1L0A9_TETUR